MRALLLAERARCAAIVAERDKLVVRNERLEAIISEIRRAYFGRKSERITDDQLSLALEEAEAQELGERLVRTLLKTQRKGWAVWLSTQQPGKLGPSPALTAALLDGLQNQVIHKLEKALEIEVVIAALKADGHALVDLDYVRQAFKSMAKAGQAILRGAGATGPLPPVLIRVPKL